MNMILVISYINCVIVLTIYCIFSYIVLFSSVMGLKNRRIVAGKGVRYTVSGWLDVGWLLVRSHSSRVAPCCH